MNAGVPMIAPDRVSSLSPSTRLARPKSVDVGLPLGVHQDIGRLQVAMEDAPLMGMMDRTCRHGHQPGRRRGSAV